MTQRPSQAVDDSCFLREPGTAGTDYDPQYVANGRLALDSFFDYLAQAEPLTPDSLIAACARMHRLFSLGESGESRYQRLDRTSHPGNDGHYSLDGMPPGEFRSETTKPLHSIRPKATEYAEFLYRTIFGGTVPLAAGPIRIEGVEPEAWPYNKDYFYPQYGETARVHFYPAARHIPAYFAAAAPLLEQARAVQSGATDVIQSVAAYYFTMVNARPYAVLNNGLFMGQVNVLLLQIGHDPACHGALDHLAHRFQFAEFEYLFRQHLLGKLPPSFPSAES